MKYLIWSHERRGWWKPKQSGYTSQVIEAGRYSLEQAEKICADANSGRIEEPFESFVPETPYEYAAKLARGEA